MVEQRTVAIGRRVKLVEIIGEKTSVEFVNLGYFFVQRRVIAMMGSWVMRIRYADLGVGATS